jgi:hypothetical protein
MPAYRWYPLIQVNMRGATSLKITLTIGIATLALVAVSGCSGRGGESVGKVFGDKLSRDDLNLSMAAFGTPNAPTVRVRTQSGDTDAMLAEPIAFQALRNVIIRKVTIQLAKEDGVAPTAKDVDDEFNFRNKLDPDYLTKRTKSGLTMSLVKQMIEYDLARERLITNGIKVDTAEAEKFFKENPDKFTESATADLLWIAVRTAEKRAAVDKDLLSGESFSYVAGKYSEVPNARENRGAFPQRAINRMDARIQKAIADTKENHFTANWVDLGEGVTAKFYVNAKTPPKLIEMDKYRMEELRRRIALERGAVSKDLNTRVLDKLRDSAKTIQIQDSALADMWRVWLERITKTAKDTPSTTTNAGDTPAK